MSVKKVLLIDNYDSFTYNLVHLFRDVGVSTLTVVRNDKLLLEDVDSFSHIVLSPGPGIPSEAGLMMDVINAYKTEKVFLGVCLGHQGLAESFGASLLNIQKVAHGTKHEISVDNTSPLFNELPPQIAVGRYHSWVVDRDTLPSDLIVTAEMKSEEDGDLVMAFSHKDLPISGIQFHPESIMTEDGAKMVSNWIDE